MKIQRYYQNFEELLKKGKIIVLYGPRRVGKTTLIKDLVSNTNLKSRYVNGDHFDVQQVFSSKNPNEIGKFVENIELLIIDEAQQISDIGMGLKILVDNHPNLYVVATGSASFDLQNKIGEPLVGRKFTYNLYPISQLELLSHHNSYELKNDLEKYLIWGGYPDVITSSSISQKTEYINEVAKSYLLKDLLAIENVKGSKVLYDLLKLLAFQIGSEVSLTELGSQLGIDRKTVGRYLDLLEKSFIIFNLSGFSRNLRKEITKQSKYYFFDLGVRNALISNFNDLDIRNDVGQLWENFLVTERIKKQSYKKIYSNNYFWRTWGGQEIDWVEMRDGKLMGYEFKWGNKTPKPPKDWIETYEEAEYKVINRDNYLDFIT